METSGLPTPECLVAKEPVHGGLNGIYGQVCCTECDCLR